MVIWYIMIYIYIYSNHINNVMYIDIYIYRKLWLSNFWASYFQTTPSHSKCPSTNFRWISAPENPRSIASGNGTMASTRGTTSAFGNRTSRSLVRSVSGRTPMDTSSPDASDGSDASDQTDHEAIIRFPTTPPSSGSIIRIHVARVILTERTY